MKFSIPILVLYPLVLLIFGIPSPLSNLKFNVHWHNVLELISIVISYMIFAVAYSSRKRLYSAKIILVGSLFFMVGTLDLLHTLSYVGMPDFITVNSFDKTLIFWLSARVVTAFAFLVMILPENVFVIKEKYWWAFFLTTSAFLVGIVFIVFMAPDWIPKSFDVVTGLTQFKKNVEYVCMLLVWVSSFMIWQKIKSEEKQQESILKMEEVFKAAIVFSLMGVFFTIYTVADSWHAISGHIYKVIGSLFLYKALVSSLIDAPYENIKVAKNKANLALNGSGTGLWFFNKNTKEVELSDSWVRIFGYEKEDKGEINDLDFFKKVVHKEDIDRVLKNIKDFFDKKDEMIYEDEYRIKKKNEEYAWVISKASKDLSGLNYAIYGATIDISERKEFENKMQKMANFDSLTGLPNRYMLKKETENLLNLTKINNNQLALFFVDLDHFKNINDTIGHSAGDEVLSEVGLRLVRAVGNNGFVARLGGDEFVINIPNCEKEKMKTKIHEISKQVIAELGCPIFLKDGEFNLSCSLGVAIYPKDGVTYEELAKKADLAMYAAKTNGRNCLMFFAEEMERNLKRSLRIKNLLHFALDNDEMFVHYQPQYQIYKNGDKKLIGVEALMRWENPELGVVSPSEFIPIAENSGMIVHMGDWIIRKVCKQIKEWEEAGVENLAVCVNVSPIQFKNEMFVDVIESTIKKYKIDANLLQLEITEGVMMEDPGKSKKVIASLVKTGINFLIDDFGTGYSSLNYLKEFNVYKLKIDRSFIANIEKSPNDEAIIKAVINIAKSFGFRVIAEGVETQEQVNFLLKNGCEEFQGYFFGKPMGVVELFKDHLSIIA